MKKFVFTLTAMSIAYSALAVNVVGKYNGKLSIDFTAIKAMVKQKSKDPKQTEQALAGLDAQSKMLSNMVIKLELKKDGTLTIDQPGNGKDKTDTGNWSVKGNTITLSNLSKKDNGPKTLTGTISKDGKTIFFDLTEVMKKETAKTGGPSPKGSMTFTKA